MILSVHILIAVVSVIAITVAAMFPTIVNLKIAGVIAGMTVFSGIAMIIVNPVFTKQACISGVVYIGFVLGVVFLNRRISIWKRMAGTNN